VLAEAGDGSMRDALSIMDQAIACCGTTITGDAVRGLVGSVGSEVLEDLLGAVERNSSEEALRLLDRLMTEGQNPAHFAKQLVRFLRNVLVAKLAGDASPLLQISSDERARAARVAAQFSEEDLARFLQIMLRTHDELGYRQEPRFHLELGVLKLVHAQRILPLEQMLSQAAADAPKSQPTARPAAMAPSVPATAASAGSATRKQESFTSPFEADRARKGRGFDPEMSVAAQTEPQTVQVGTAVAVAEPEPTGDPEKLLGHVLSELENGGHKMLASTLESGTVSLEGNELVITVAQSAAVLDVMMGAEPRRIANAAASAAAGRVMKVTVRSGAAAANNGSAPAPAARQVRNGASARSRAAEDPVVQRMQEKFGAEIRTVIDYRNKS
jgi:DNA polymerase-3 subunit gamma/tau